LRLDRSPEHYFNGNDVVPFLGVVENVDDPMQIGRVQVRAIGIHPERSDGQVPTEHLPWAYVMLPTTASGTSGVGSTHGLTDGSWVFGFFMDGRDAQQPFVVGTFVGAPGLSNLQREYVKSGLAIGGNGPGGLAGAFQTAAASAVSGLGAPTKFGAQVGSFLSIVDLLKNSDALRTLAGSSASGPTGSTQLPVAKVIDAAASGRIASAVAGALPNGIGAVAATLPSFLTGILSLGGAKGFSGGGTNPLSSASIGSSAPPGMPTTADNATVEVKTDYDKLAMLAPDDVGAITVYSTGTPKTKRYTLDAMNRDARARGDDAPPFHYAIDQTGQIIKTRSLSNRAATGRNAGNLSVGGVGMNNITVALVGGLPSGARKGTSTQDGSMMSKFYPLQLSVLEKFVAAHLRRFPNAVVAGGSEVDGGAAVGFNVSEWALERFPKNANAPASGTAKLMVPGGAVAGPATADDSNSTSVGGSVGQTYTGQDASATGLRKGFQGGPSHPNPAYAAKYQSDVPAMARTNALSVMGRGLAASAAAGGGPVQQYLSKLEEPATRTFARARKADSLEARSVPEKWSPPVRAHGGEYGSAHVVRSTEAGHHVLLDDTPGREKVEIMHASGSMLQIHADGGGTFYVKKDMHEVVIGDKWVGIQGGMDLSVGGDLKISVKGDMAWDVTGKITLNGASTMHELIRGDKTSVVEGSQLTQTKKTHVTRVGKDSTLQVGGKMDTTVKGTRHDVTRGSSSSTTYGESQSFNAGNRNTLTLGSETSHAQNQVFQSRGDTIIAAKGNAVVSAKGKGTVIAQGDVIVESKGAMKVKTGGELALNAGGRVNMNATGNVDIDGADVKIEAGSSSAVTGTTPADVTEPPAQVTRESNPADSNSNLNAEQVTLGEQDKEEAQDIATEGGGASDPIPGGVNSGGGASGSDSAFRPAQSQGEVPAAESLGNHKQDACGIAQDLVSRGWSREGASAAVGNMINESSLNPNAINPSDSNGLPSAGLIQWNGPRRDALIAYSESRNLNWQTREAQIGFLDAEASAGGAEARHGLKSAGDMQGAIVSAARYIRFQGYDSPFTGGAWDNSNGNRASNSLGVYNECFGGNVQSVGGQTAGDVSGFTGGDQEGTSGDPTVNETGTGEGGDNSSERAPYVTGTDGDIDWNMKVSPNFTLGQLTPTSKFVKGMNPTPRGAVSSDELIANLSACAVNVLEPMLAALGRPHVNSGYRSLAYNNSLRARGGGAAKNSDHIYGKAVDVTVPGMSNAAVANWIDRNLPTVAGVGRYSSFTHVSYYRGGNGGRIRHWSG
jgi:tail lysozyme/peptidase M15-like protein/Gp5-like OB domain-containing protein